MQSREQVSRSKLSTPAAAAVRDNSSGNSRILGCVLKIPKLPSEKAAARDSCNYCAASGTQSVESRVCAFLRGSRGRDDRSDFSILRASARRQHHLTRDRVRAGRGYLGTDATGFCGRARAHAYLKALGACERLGEREDVGRRIVQQWARCAT